MHHEEYYWDIPSYRYGIENEKVGASHHLIFGIYFKCVEHNDSINHKSQIGQRRQDIIRS